MTIRMTAGEARGIAAENGWEDSVAATVADAPPLPQEAIDLLRAMRCPIFPEFRRTDPIDD
jgi:hypothetical protein